MKQIVPPKKEICVKGVWYQAGQEYEDGIQASKKETKLKVKESSNGD